MNSNETAYFAWLGRVRACNDFGCSPWTGWVRAQSDGTANASAAKGPSATGCSPGIDCHWLSINISGLAAFESYTLTCFFEGSQGNTNVGSTQAITASASGTFNGVGCKWGIPGRLIWYSVTHPTWDDDTSNQVLW